MTGEYNGRIIMSVIDESIIIKRPASSICDMLRPHQELYSFVFFLFLSLYSTGKTERSKKVEIYERR